MGAQYIMIKVPIFFFFIFTVKVTSSNSFPEKVMLHVLSRVEVYNSRKWKMEKLPNLKGKTQSDTCRFTGGWQRGIGVWREVRGSQLWRVCGFWVGVVNEVQRVASVCNRYHKFKWTLDRAFKQSTQLSHPTLFIYIKPELPP
jgi:hypothetical protein